MRLILRIFYGKHGVVDPAVLRIIEQRVKDLQSEAFDRGEERFQFAHFFKFYVYPQYHVVMGKMIGEALKLRYARYTTAVAIMPPR